MSEQQAIAGPSPAEKPAQFLIHQDYTKEPANPIYTTQAIIEALKQHGGLVYKAAAFLGCNASLIYRRAQASKVIQEILDSARTRIVEKAQHELELGIERGNATLIMFALSRLNKRYYGEKQTIEHTGTIRNESISVDLDKLNPDQLRELAAILAKAKPPEKAGEE